MLQRSTHLIMLLIALSLSMISFNSYAWGQNGHRIVAKIAQQHLTEKTKQALIPLLENESLPQISTWPDEMRSDPADFWQQKSTPWHYINFKSNTQYEILNDTSVHSKDSVENIFQGIQYAIFTLNNTKASIDEKRFALRFMVHLVGDSHQPFHAGRGEDRGGNHISVIYFGQDTNLHSLWDSKLIESENLSYTEFAEFIDTNNTTLIAEYLESKPKDWLMESHNLAESIYDKNITDISYTYVHKNLPIIKTRLLQGGIRLAGLLNLIFDESAKPLVSALKMQTNKNTKH